MSRVFRASLAFTGPARVVGLAWPCPLPPGLSFQKRHFRTRTNAVGHLTVSQGVGGGRRHRLDDQGQEEDLRWRLAGADRPRQLRSLTVLRSAVEPVAGRLAAELATAEECAELTQHALGMVATSRGQQLEAYLVHDVAFHRVVLRASRNEMFARLGDVVAEVLTGRTEHHVMFTDPDPAAVTLHVQFAEAVRARDAARAEQLTREITIGAMAELDMLAPK
ncbi:FadR/GntR family transcriptional regulator [Streptomyces sp. 7N604]|uniref:FadR/GntR family transcriptional regulator n=1 Tax=Streptomyces sp. 7N604 TaxID=3457415 RepID=UPI003FD3AE19